MDMFLEGPFCMELTRDYISVTLCLDVLLVT